ncbi:NPC intracellular cholesterol transporter 2-like [Culicoides brevitarsis]|uniref:NPC intracellular cholesterol transporter 2-like n=1 Tax=Culicoides brevitarsis TaxID=469753 RepID=UPI00307BAF10
MSTHYKIIFLLSLLQSLRGLEVRSCGSEPLPFQVSVDGCDAEPCKVVNKQKIHFEIDFKTPADTEALKAHAEAFLDNLQLPYEVPKENQNACQFITNTECPLKAGDEVTYELSFTVDTPIIQTLDLKFELKDDRNSSVFCIRTKVSIVES